MKPKVRAFRRPDGPFVVEVHNTGERLEARLSADEAFTLLQQLQRLLQDHDLHADTPEHKGGGW